MAQLPRCERGDQEHADYRRALPQIGDEIMQTISTKYHGATNTRGSRISATSTGGSRVYVPYRDEYSTDQNHREAVRKLTKKLGWTGRLQSGGTKAGKVWVFVDIAGQMAL